ncbi:hypothetical protein H0H92_014191, partial [Tricholoma furcatifolium]
MAPKKSTVAPTVPREPRKGANSKPAQVVLDARQRRRTAAEIKAEGERVARERAESTAQANAVLHEKISSTAIIKDRLRQEDLQAAKAATHPDRQPAKNDQLQPPLAPIKRLSEELELKRLCSYMNGSTYRDTKFAEPSNDVENAQANPTNVDDVHEVSDQSDTEKT